MPATWVSSSAGSPWVSSGVLPASCSPPVNWRSVGHRQVMLRGGGAGTQCLPRWEQAGCVPLTICEDTCALSPNGTIHQITPGCLHHTVGCLHAAGSAHTAAAPSRARSTQPSSPHPPPPAGPGDTGHHIPPAQRWWQWVTSSPPMWWVQRCMWVTSLHLVTVGHRTAGGMPCPPACQAPNPPSKHPDNARCERETGRGSVPAPMAPWGQPSLALSALSQVNSQGQAGGFLETLAEEVDKHEMGELCPGEAAALSLLSHG